MENNKVNVAFILDDNFVIPTITAITSLIENKNQNTEYDIYLITNNLSPKNIYYFESMAQLNFNIYIKKLNENYKNFKITNNGFHVSPSAILKFKLDEILQNLDKVLYLDGDIIIQKDLSNLYNTILNDKYAAVVEDLRPKYRYITSQLEKLGIKEHQGYFNSGVMLLNLNLIRKQRLQTNFFDYRTNGTNNFMDQDCLNVVFKDNVLFLSPENNFLITLEKDFDIFEINKLYNLNDKYNEISTLVKNCTILHFSSKFKPWKYKNTPYSEIWYFYFKKTIIKRNLKLKKFKISQNHKISNLLVSLTSYPARINSVDKTIKSLLNQTLQPKKILLTLGEDKFPNKEADLPDSLKSLFSDKFEILWTPKDLRSYTKLVPTLQKYPNNIIVTVDDDIIYKNDMLETLYEAYKKLPNLIHCHRAHRITFDKKKNMCPYKNWVWSVKKVKPSFNNFLTGVGGVLYPPYVLNKDVFNIELFQKLAPMADDIWFWAMAVLNNTKINVIKNNYSKLSCIDGTQENCLWKTNVDESQNDEQMKNVLDYYPQIFEKLDKRIFKNITFLQSLFSTTNLPSLDGKWHKVIYIIGLKFSFRNKKKEEQMKKLKESRTK